MKTMTRIVLLGAVLTWLSATEADASRFSRPAARSTSTSRSSSARRPNRVMRLLARPFQRVARTASPMARQSTAPGVRPQARNEIAAYTQMMEGSIYQNATPPFALIHMSSSHSMREVRSSSYKQGITAKFQVTGLRGGTFPVTALFPVSGHVGQAEAARYSRTNVYSVEIEYADGTTETMRVNATGYVTEKALDLKLQKGTNYVRFFPEGSGGVGGFRSGREIELEYDGN